METKVVTQEFPYENPQNHAGRYAKVDISDLCIPANDEKSFKANGMQPFQRDAVNDATIKRMASRWDWLLCGALTVAQVKDKFLVIDGGHRLRAARLKGIKHLPCMVYSDVETAMAARAFLGIQKLRRTVSQVQQHKSGLLAGDPFAELAEKIVTDNNYTIDKNSTFSSVAALYSLLRINPQIAETAFGICAEICNGERIFKDILMGVFELELQTKKQKLPTVFENIEIEKLTKMGIPKIIGAINGIRFSQGSVSGANSRSIPARAMLDLINKGRKRKIRINFAS